MALNNAQLINQTSVEVDYYTDPRITAAAREVMGSIDLDPASSSLANKSVKAIRWYGPDDNSLERHWDGNIWLNHPFGRREEPCQADCKKRHKHHAIKFFGNAAWIKKLMQELRADHLHQSLNITYACTSEAWFQPLLDFPQCFLSPRTNYYLPDGTIKKGVTKGSVVTYLGPNVDRFAAIFQQFGKIKIRYVPRLDL